MEGEFEFCVCRTQARCGSVPLRAGKPLGVFGLRGKEPVSVERLEQ